MKPKSQFDHAQRVVSLENLAAMCARVSGTCHRYRVESMTNSRVVVSYSNPDEYGNEKPVNAWLPCYPQHDACAVVLDPLRYTGGRDEEDWQAFQALWDCSPLFRNENGLWRTELEILQTRNPGHEITQRWKDGGSVCAFVYKENEFKTRDDAEQAALGVLRTLEDARHRQREIERIT